MIIVFSDFMTRIKCNYQCLLDTCKVVRYVGNEWIYSLITYVTIYVTIYAETFRTQTSACIVL